jgi:hypothetical protein
MKEILNEWKRFVNESKGNPLQLEIDLEKDEIILYHVGWLRPDKPFGVHKKHMFSGEPKSHASMKRPLGNESVYFSSSKAGAEIYKKYSEFPFLHKVKIPISKLAGAFQENNVQMALQRGVTASEEDFLAFVEQTKQNYETDYGAEYQNLGSSLEVGVFDASIIERIDATPLFEVEDLRKYFDKVIGRINRVINTPRNEEGRFIIKNSFGTKLYDNAKMLRRIEETIERYTYNSKERSKIETFKYYFPGEWEALMEKVEQFKQSLGGS